MADLFFHNTLTGRKEKFQPLVPGRVGMYVCGITPYDESHLGHARAYVVFDMLKRVLLKLGYALHHVQNFTDVDDKIIDRALKNNLSPFDYPKPFMQHFLDNMKRLNVLPADRYPLVTTHIPPIIKMIEALLARGFAYEVEGDVYYSVRRYKEYGVLAKRNIDELESGARVDVDERKKDPLDFALWKKAKAGEPSWASPWGAGRPGWHIECSAMSIEYLGPEFDIHGGGMDLIFPHHTNEIAQSVGATGKPFARYWIHNGFVTIDEQKMSKSLGNFFTIKDILATFDPMVVRYFLLGQHYRSPLNFSDQTLRSAEVAWRDRICGAHRLVSEIKAAPATFDPAEKDTRVAPFLSALLDDLNTAEALGLMNTLCSEIYAKHGAGTLTPAHASCLGAALDEMLNLLGLLVPEADHWSADIWDLVQQRQQARQNKNWAESDRLRDELKKRGAVVEDSASGPRLKKVP